MLHGHWSTLPSLDRWTMRLLYPLITLTVLIYIHERTKLQLSIYSLLDCYTTDHQYSLLPAEFKTFVPVLQALIRTSHPNSDNPSYTATYHSMSDRTRLKHGTKHIQKYLMKASIESTGHLSWIKKCRTDPDTPTDHMKISVFLRCGEIIANDLLKLPSSRTASSTISGMSYC
jgi:hypothetical protein